MANKLRGALDSSKVVLLTLVVVVSFVMSSFGWRHIETSESTRVLVAAAILLSMYALMVFELVNRNLAALIGAAASVAAYDCLVEYIEMDEILQWEDLETLSLLFGMMIIVNILGCSGLFDYLAVWSYKKSASRFWALIIIMSFITAFLSAFIDNVSTMLLMSPTLVKLSELEHIDPRYMLMIMVVFSNIGGCATPVGDPPNLIIINDNLVGSLGITFGSFVSYCGPCVLITIGAILFYFKLKYKSKDGFRVLNKQAARNNNLETVQHLELTRSDRESTPVNGHHQEAAKIKELTLRLKAIVREQGNRNQGGDKSNAVASLERQIGRLEQELNGSSETKGLKRAGSTNGTGAKLDNFQHMKRQDQLKAEQIELDARRGSRLTDEEITKLLRLHSIKSQSILTLSLSVLVVTIVLFFVQSVPGIRLTLGWVSLFAGLTLLVASSSIQVVAGHDKDKTDGDDDDDDGEDESVLSVVTTNDEAAANSENFALAAAADQGQSKDGRHDNFEHVINNVEWSTLMFFFALFIVMEVMAELGLIEFVGSQISGLVDMLPAGPMRSIGAITIILWASGLASACIDNVPFTSMMIKVLGSIASSSSEGFDTKPLVFALAFGACYGGNGTLIGASANLVTAGLAGRYNYPITFNDFFKFAAPATILSLIIANVYLVVVFVLFGL